MATKLVAFEIKILGSGAVLEAQQALRKEIRENKKALEGINDAQTIKQLGEEITEAQGRVKALTKTQNQNIKAAESLEFVRGSYRQIQAQVGALTEDPQVIVLIYLLALHKKLI